MILETNNCPQCGAPVPIRSDHCEYCRSIFILDTPDGLMLHSVSYNRMELRPTGSIARFPTSTSPSELFHPQSFVVPGRNK